MDMHQWREASMGVIVEVSCSVFCPPCWLQLDYAPAGLRYKLDMWSDSIGKHHGITGVNAPIFRIVVVRMLLLWLENLHIWFGAQVTPKLIFKCRGGNSNGFHILIGAKHILRSEGQSVPFCKGCLVFQRWLSNYFVSLQSKLKNLMSKALKMTNTQGKIIFILDDSKASLWMCMGNYPFFNGQVNTSAEFSTFRIRQL